MNLGLQDKVAMVVAASKGIGLATAQELAREGCRVSICARNRDALDAALATLPGGMGCLADVARIEDLERWFSETKQQLGAADILVTNTGGPPVGLVGALDDAQWRQGVDSTLMNVVRMVRLAAPDMITRGWGRIVHVTSLVAKEPNPMLAISSTLRAGLMALTRLQATELAPHGVTVNGVLPGHTLTDRQRELAEVTAKAQGITVERSLELRAESVPMKRLADAHEIAAAIAFLSSTRASYVTGVNLLVDGGLTRGPG
ncbi:MAG TPA: SDR family oxidoreductase [Fimbriimonadaceae bacterium]|nr:SDR family oxidoreductase [Fimbriimonadaceae bacterium]